MNSKTPMDFSALNRQKQIYLNGISGVTPLIPFDHKKLTEKAKEKMSPEGFAYVAGGAGIEKTMHANRTDFNNWQIYPSMLKDVSSFDLSIELFGKKLPTPFLTAPIGVLEMAHKEADLAVARACSSIGIPMIFSNQASIPMEKCAEAMGNSPHWFQLYWSKSNDLVASLVNRAQASGCDAIVVTLDTPLLGWRIQDLDLAYLPFLRGKGIAQYTSDPVFQKLLDETLQADNQPSPKQKLSYDSLASYLQIICNYPGGFLKNFRSKRPLEAVKLFIDIYSRTNLTWENISFLRKHTSLPIILKGIVHEEDAQKAIDYGINGIIVSNHGGRQIDGAISAITALPKVVKVVKNQIPVLMDSGIRGGADVFKALALGAKAVCIGRPFVYALALAGEAGVRELLLNYIADFELTMRLSGCCSIKEINTNSLA